MPPFNMSRMFLLSFVATTHLFPSVFSSADAGGISITELAKSPIFSNGTVYVRLFLLDEMRAADDDDDGVGSGLDVPVKGKFKASRAS